MHKIAALYIENNGARNMKGTRETNALEWSIHNEKGSTQTFLPMSHRTSFFLLFSTFNFALLFYEPLQYPKYFFFSYWNTFTSTFRFCINVSVFLSLLYGGIATDKRKKMCSVITLYVIVVAIALHLTHHKTNENCSWNWTVDIDIIVHICIWLCVCIAGV